MKKILTTLTLVMMTISMSFAAANKYQADDAAMDNLFSNATEISYNDLNAAGDFANLDFSATKVRGGDSPIVAFLICWFIGSLGIHRLYMGTKGIVIVGYILTAGGCGIITLIDWIMLLVGVINSDISKYVDNPAFIMW